MGEPYILRHCPKRKGLVRVPYVPELGGFPDCTCEPKTSLPTCEAPKPETTSQLIARSERLIGSLSKLYPEVLGKSKPLEKTTKEKTAFILNKQ